MTTALTQEVELLRELRAKATLGEWQLWPHYCGTDPEHAGEYAEVRLLGTDQFDTFAELRQGHDDLGGSPEANGNFIVALVNWFDKHADSLTHRSPPAVDGEVVDQLLWHVEQVCGPLSRETSVTTSDDDYSILRHNFRAILSAPRGDGDAVRAAAIEECAKVADGWACGHTICENGQCERARVIAQDIRALAPVSVEGEQGVGSQGGGA